MIDAGVTALLWFDAIGCGLLAGLFFAFSAFIMAALRRAGPAVGIAAMNSINDTILRSLFMPLFWGTTLASLALSVIAFFDLSATAAKAMLAGGLVLLLGMFVCTVAIEVPLNNELTSADGESEASLGIWRRYLTQWTRWNHVRTIACAVSCALFVWALVERG